MNKVRFYNAHFTDTYAHPAKYEWRLCTGYPVSIDGIDFTFAVFKRERDSMWIVVNTETGYMVGEGKTKRSAISLTSSYLQSKGNAKMASAVEYARNKGFIPPPVPTSEDCASL